MEDVWVNAEVVRNVRMIFREISCVRDIVLMSFKDTNGNFSEIYFVVFLAIGLVLICCVWHLRNIIN